jgi:hypothetical protein
MHVLYDWFAPLHNPITLVLFPPLQGRSVRAAMPVRAAIRVASQVPSICAARSGVVTDRSGITLPVPAMRTERAVFLAAVTTLLVTAG